MKGLVVEGTYMESPAATVEGRTGLDVDDSEEMESTSKTIYL